MSVRVHDLAVEFGVPSDELMGLLREMEIFVRSHLSSLEEDKVSRVRARWEREKRRTSQVTAAPAKTRRRAPAKPKRAPEPAPEVAEAARPKRRRRTAAQAAVMEAEQAAAAAAAEPVEAAGLFRVELPAVAAERQVIDLFPPELAVPTPSEAIAPPDFAPPTSPAAPAPPARAEAAAPPAEPPYPSARPEAVLPLRQVPLPRPGMRPPSARPRPVASAVPGATQSGLATGQPPRPVASAAPGGSVEERRRDRKKRKKGKRSQVDQEAVAEAVSRTLASIRAGTRKGVRRRDDEPSFQQLEAQRRAEELEREKTLVRVNEFISVAELAEILQVQASEIVAFSFKELGLMVTVNQRLDFDQIELICSEFGFKAVREEEYAAGVAEPEAPEPPEALEPRPPVVTVMGHVDHGKTSLLDFVRKTNVIAGEAGGITQHIGAYHVELPNGRKITFLDTPGHEAFTAMRARGAQVTDIVVLVIAADDQVMPQTVEAISHAKNAGVPLVVAINKIDLPTADVEKVKRDLLQQGVVLEGFGGTTLATPISAKSGTNVQALLDQVLLQAELLDLRASPARKATGTVLEASLDPGRGPVATVLVMAGTLHVGDDFISGMFSGRVRALQDERGKAVQEACPSIPVQVLGFEGVPQAGDAFTVVEDSAHAREVAQKRQRLDREAQHRRGARSGLSLEEFFRQRAAAGGEGILRLIIKADQGGPAEALADALSQLSTAEVRVEVIHRGVGAITESDVLLAKAAQAIVVGFQVRPDSNARAAAERDAVDIRLYRVIYEAVEDVRAALEGLLKPEEREVVVGEAEVRQLFKISGVGTIAGCFVRSGVIQRSGRARVIRDGVEVYSGSLASLRRFKDDVKEVREGLECGIGIENFNDVKVSDLVEVFRVETIARTLEAVGPARGGGA